MDISAVPTIELLNVQNCIEGNIGFLRKNLDTLTKAKGVLKKYDMDNKRVNKLITKLDDLQSQSNKVTTELTRRAQEAINYDFEIENFDKLQQEIDGKFAEATKIYLENQQKNQPAPGNGAQMAKA